MTSAVIDHLRAGWEAAYSPFVLQFQGTLYGKNYGPTNFATWDDYANWRTSIAALPASQAYASFMAACSYIAGCDPSIISTVTSQRRGTTQNIQVLGPDGEPLPLDVSAASGDSSHTGVGHGGNDSWYIGGQFDVLHVVDVENPYAAALPGAEAYIDPFSLYGIGAPLHGIEYLLSVIVPNGASTTFNCSMAGCY